MATATELTVTLEDRPGTLADMAEALGNAGVNIDGLQGAAVGGKGMVQVITNNPKGATQALDKAGLKYTTREVLLVKLEDKPGALGRLARAMAKAGVNITASYLTMKGTLALGVSDMPKAEKVARDMGVM